MVHRFQGPVDNDPSTVLSNTNNLLSVVGISTKKVTSMGELTRVASSMFVAVFESLFHVRLEGIIRNPQNREEYAHNAQRVIDSLSERIQMDLQHITGDLIVRGDMSALSNLVHIFVRIVSMTSQESQEFSGMDIYLKGRGRHADIMSEDLGDSISTHESTFQQPHSGTRSRLLMRRDDDPDRSTDRSTDRSLSLSASGELNRIGHKDARELFKSSHNTFLQEEKMQAARSRRSTMQKMRENNSVIANKRRAEISNRALQRRWVEDAKRDNDAFDMRRQNEENVMLRKMYKGLLSKMHEWSADEQNELRQKVSEMKEEAKWHIQSLQALFEDRVRLLREKAVKTDDSVIKAQRQMGSELKKSFSEQRQVALRDQKNMILQKRQHQLVRRREAQKDLLSLLSVEKWDDSLRNYSPSAEKVFAAPVTSVLGLGGVSGMGGGGGGGGGSGVNVRLTGGVGGGGGVSKRGQRPRSAPPIMRRANIIHASSMSNSKRVSVGPSGHTGWSSPTSTSEIVKDYF